MKIKLFIVFTVFTNLYSLKAQNVLTHYIDIDSVEIQLVIFKQNKLVSNNFKDRFIEKDSSDSRFEKKVI